MRKLYLIFGLILITLTACPQKKGQTFDEPAYFTKGFYMPDGKGGTVLYSTIPTGVSSVTWALITGKPVNFLPAPHTHLWSDVTANPGDVYLKESLEALQYLPIPAKTTAEITKIIIPDGKSGIVFNRSDTVLQVWYNKKWRNFILNQ